MSHSLRPISSTGFSTHLMKARPSDSTASTHKAVLRRPLHSSSSTLFGKALKIVTNSTNRTWNSEGNSSLRIWTWWVRLKRAGVPILAGTDGPYLQGGDALHANSSPCGSGPDPTSALQAASRDAARAMGVLKDVGTVEVGKTADLVLLDATH